ncbi:MAG: hypothetical protein ACJAYG_002639, partial [Oceanicoccus sp.]
GEVNHIEANANKEPILFTNGKYRELR